MPAKRPAEEVSTMNDGLSRRAVLQGGAVAGAAAAVTGSSPAHAYREGALRADFVLHNGRIHTMDRRHRIASTVAIQDGRIVYIGNDTRAARRAFDGNPRLIDLRGRTAVPGL